MKKSKITALLLAGTLAVTSFLPSVTASAVPSYCQRLINGNQCGKLVKEYETGRSISYEESHEYGGFLNTFGKKTCTYEYYYKYVQSKCSAGHVASTARVKVESGHICGE